MLLDWAVLAVSFYNTISLLWLGLTVFLNGNRRSGGTWLTGGGLLLGALFFTSHTAIMGRGLASTSFGMDFWWWVSWTPAIAAPFAWYGALLWYTGFDWRRPHPHRFWLAGVVALAGLTALLILVANPLPSYSYVAGRPLAATPRVAGLPVLVLAYLVYSVLCYLLPLDLLRRAELTARPVDAVARRLARPWLVAVSVLLLLAGLLMVWTARWALLTIPQPSLTNPADAVVAKRFDLVVESLVALAITLLGRAIVAYEVFTGRPLPRHGLFRQWRGTVILTTGYGVVAAWTLTIQLRPLYSLMLATALWTFFYVLYNWRTTAERERAMARLRPFIASQDLYAQLVNAAPADAAAPPEIFATLCRDVLGVRAAALLPSDALATLAGPPLRYPPQAPLVIPPPGELAACFASPEVRCRPLSVPELAWAVSLWSGQSLGGLLLLGEKIDGNPYTEEEIELAQAGGERVLDMLAGAEMARLAMDLLRQRLAQVRVLEGQGRRLLHDEVLPQLHTALLYVSALPATPETQAALESLSAVHHRIADLLHDAPPAGPQLLAQQGLVAALRLLVERELAGEFAGVDWRVAPEAEVAAQRLPLFVAEVVYFAARELLRNAARHGRGGETARPLHLTLTIERTEGLRLVVEDDGVGFTPGADPAAGGAGSGLRFHSALLAAVGAGLEVRALPAGGTRAAIVLRGGG